ARLAAAQRKALAHGKPGKVNHLIARASQSLSAIVRKTRQAAYKKHAVAEVPTGHRTADQRRTATRAGTAGLSKTGDARRAALPAGRPRAPRRRGAGPALSWGRTSMAVRRRAVIAFAVLALGLLAPERAPARQRPP